MSPPDGDVALLGFEGLPLGAALLGCALLADEAEVLPGVVGLVPPPEATPVDPPAPCPDAVVAVPPDSDDDCENRSRRLAAPLLIDDPTACAPRPTANPVPIPTAAFVAIVRATPSPAAAPSMIGMTRSRPNGMNAARRRIAVPWIICTVPVPPSSAPCISDAPVARVTAMAIFEKHNAEDEKS